MSNNTKAKEITVLDEPLVYEDSPDIPEEHREKVEDAIKNVDEQVLQFRTHADTCYEATSIEELEEALEKLEFEVRKEFFYGLATTVPTGLPTQSILWELMVESEKDPKNAARWCAKLDPEYGTAYAMGWVQKQQTLLSLGLPNDASMLDQGRALSGETTPAPKQLTAEPESRSLKDRVYDKAKRASRWLQNKRKKEKHHG